MPSGPAAALLHVFRHASIDARRCVRYPRAAARARLFLPRPSPVHPPRQEPLCSKARPAFPASPLRTSLPIQRHPLLPKPRCPPWDAFRPPAFLRGRGESPETARFPFRAATATTHRPALYLPRRRLPGGAARSARSTLPDWLQPPARPPQTSPAKPPPPKGTAAQSNRWNPKWITVSRGRSSSFLSVG